MVTADGVCFVYKRAAIVGKLGDNAAALRRALRDDADLHALLTLPSAAVTVLAHTRWASVGRISEANAHPVDSHIAGADGTGPFSVAVLNGDIDNYGALSKQIGYEPDERGITTDAKVIPVLLSQRLVHGADPGECVVRLPRGLRRLHGHRGAGRDRGRGAARRQGQRPVGVRRARLQRFRGRERGLRPGRDHVQLSEGGRRGVAGGHPAGHRRWRCRAAARGRSRPSAGGTATGCRAPSSPPRCARPR